MKSKKKILTTLGTLAFITPALALTAISCNKNSPSNVPTGEPAPYITSKQKHINLIKDTIKKFQALDTTSKTTLAPLSLQDKLIYSKDVAKITAELGVDNTIELPRDTKITSIDWDPVYDGNQKLKLFQNNNQNVAAVKVTMKLQMEYYDDDKYNTTYYEEAFDWIIKGFKPTNKEDLTVEDWKKAYPDQVKYLYQIPSNATRNHETQQERIDQLYRIFVDKDDLRYNVGYSLTGQYPTEKKCLMNFKMNTQILKIIK